MQEFKHYQSAHCENGVTIGLLRQAGLHQITEPLAFGIGSGLFYIDIPFLTLQSGPAISFRSIPGSIFKRTCKAFDVKLQSHKYRDEDKAMAEMDALLAEGKSIGCQVGVYHLTYYPKEYRFHFNAHNMIVFGKEGNDYLVSDPIMEETTRLASEDMRKVRFAKGVFAPRGHIYYPTQEIHATEDQIKRAIVKGIKRNCGEMLRIPVWFIGAKGINHTAKNIRKWKSKYGDRRAALNLGQIVRMQEEIGTGGGGFRFLYAAFLEESAAILGNDELLRASEMFTNAGDMWRDSAVQMAGIYKGRLSSQADYNLSADMLTEISAVEKEAFLYLDKIKL
ncbi:MAG TPA: BtrH N-terminal domain-containing protein [Taishania sp.]|nr:BtrH N-terminal domain-containing protein [Taishania sp.]